MTGTCSTDGVMERSFFSAIMAGDHARVRAIVSEDPAALGLRSTRHFMAPPITVAVTGDDLEMVDLLLELGADINAASDWWAGPWRPLHACFDPGREAMADALIARGAEVDAHAAAGLGRIDTLRKLLDGDPQLVHARGGDGCSPLHFARTPEVAALLLERGADPEMRDIDHESTAIQWRSGKSREVTRFLLDRGARPDVFALAWLGDADRLRVFLDANPGAVHHRVGDGEFVTKHSDAEQNYAYTFGSHATPLHAAAAGGDPACARILLERGGDPGVRGGYDDSVPLHAAAWHDHAAVAAVLIEHGADIEVLSGRTHNSSPLTWAIVGGGVAVVELLVARGARITDDHRATAAAGANGEFRDYARGVAQENWNRIRTMIDVAPLPDDKTRDRRGGP
ncbi:MAG: ankyrin repeat domain-containing protein [Gemmatimonadetes bacterium]|nr:ankyrin repeat domain-containing protein [Gemmatimonadota bacterium]